jgi:hypothetical protein
VDGSGAEIARAARDCAVTSQAVTLAHWIGDGPRPVTPRQILRKSDVGPAAAAIGAAAPKLLRSAVDIPALHRPWCLALAAGLLRVADGFVSAGPGSATWPEACPDSEVLSAWLAGLRAACIAESDRREEESGAIGRMLVALTVLGREVPPAGDALWFAMRDEALAQAAESDLDWMCVRADGSNMPVVVALLSAFGAVDGEADPVITLLGRWGGAAVARRGAEPGR